MQLSQNISTPPHSFDQFAQYDYLQAGMKV